MLNNNCIIKINGIKREVYLNQTILQACESYGISIPHFCYHDKLSIAGNCRMCLVEESRSIKPLASCAITVQPNMDIYTETVLVKKAREGVMEFLLANHPLDCPICDQGGECDLQDQSMVFGGDRGRFYEEKRAVEDKNCGPFIKTIMTRCIHCTRCVRFFTEYAGNSQFGISGRGSQMEIGFYIKNRLDCEVAGNVIDLCPVGALTSKPYSFRARSWETRSYESIDFFDCFGSNVRIDTSMGSILRILPRTNKNINDEWIADKVRFAYDGLNVQRFSKALVYYNKRYEKHTTNSVCALLQQLYAALSFTNVVSTTIVGPYSSIEDIVALKTFTLKLRGNFYHQDLLHTTDLQFADFRSNYTFAGNLADLKTSSFCLMIGSNVRWEAPVLNMLFSTFVNTGKLVYVIGYPSKLNYKYIHLGNSVLSLVEILEGRHYLCYYLLSTPAPLILYNSSIFCRADHVFAALKELEARVLKFNLQLTRAFLLCCLHDSASVLNSLEVGYQPHRRSLFGETSGFVDSASTEITKVYYLAGVDLKKVHRIIKNDTTFNKLVIYFGHNGDASRYMDIIDIILPIYSPYETRGTFINLFGYVQKTEQVLFPNNSEINLLSFYLEYICSLLKVSGPHVLSDSVNSWNYILIAQRLVRGVAVRRSSKIAFFCLSFVPFSRSIYNYYLNDPISRCSKNLVVASKYFENSIMRTFF